MDLFIDCIESGMSSICERRYLEHRLFIYMSLYDPESKVLRERCGNPSVKLKTRQNPHWYANPHANIREELVLILWPRSEHHYSEIVEYFDVAICIH